MILREQSYKTGQSWSVKNSNMLLPLISTNLCLNMQLLLDFNLHLLSRVVRKPDLCICENKGADQLRGNREADQRLCFRYSDSTIPLVPKSEISSFWLYSVIVQPGLCRTWSETPKTGFLRTRLCLSLNSFWLLSSSI